MDRDPYGRDPRRNRRNPNYSNQTPRGQNVGSRSTDNDLNDPFANQVESFQHLLPNRNPQPTPSHQWYRPDTMPPQRPTATPPRTQPTAHRIPSSAYSMYPPVPDMYASNPPVRPEDNLDSSDPRGRRSTSGNELPQNTTSNNSGWPQFGSYIPSQAPGPSRDSVGVHNDLQAQGHPFAGNSTSTEPPNRSNTTLPIRPPDPIDGNSIRRVGQRIESPHDPSKVSDDLNTWMCIYCYHSANGQDRRSCGGCGRLNEAFKESSSAGRSYSGESQTAHVSSKIAERGPPGFDVQGQPPSKHFAGSSNQESESGGGSEAPEWRRTARVPGSQSRPGGHQGLSAGAQDFVPGKSASATRQQEVVSQINKVLGKDEALPSPNKKRTPTTSAKVPKETRSDRRKRERTSLGESQEPKKPKGSYETTLTGVRKEAYAKVDKNMEALPEKPKGDGEGSGQGKSSEISTAPKKPDNDGEESGQDKPK